MKISSASKKVLASALSAAMVIAFAPAVALAAPAVDGTKTVTVTYDANGGTIATGAISGETVQLYTENGKYYIDPTGTTATHPAGYSFNKWFIDNNGDGILDEKDGVEIASGSAAGYFEVPADTTTVVLKADYAKPAATTGTFVYNSANAYTANTEVGNQDASVLPVTISANGVAGHTYVLTVTNAAGTVVGTQTFGDNTTVKNTAMANTYNVYFTANPVSTDKMAALNDHLISGQYTVTLTDNGSTISTAKTSLAKATVIVGDKTDSAMAQLTAGAATVNLSSINALTGTYVAYLDANGYNVPATAAPITGDATFTATETSQAVSAVNYDEANRTMGFKLAAEGAGAGKATTYAVTVSEPGGAAVYTAEYAATSSANTVTGISFKQNAAGARTSAPEKAGDYVVTVVSTVKDTTTKKVVSTSTSKAKMTLTEIKYEAGEGTKIAAGAITDVFTDATGAGLHTYADTTAVPSVSKTDAGNTNAVSWLLNGAAYNATTNAEKAGEVNVMTAVVKAQTYADAPTYSIVKSTAGSRTQYVLTVAKAAGTTVAATVTAAAGTTTTPSTDNAIILDGTEQKVVLTASATSKANKVITLSNALKAADDWAAATSGGANKLELYIGKSSTKWLAASGVATAIAAGKTAAEGVAAKYFVDADEWAAVTNASMKAVYEAIVAEADAQVAAFADEAMIIAGDKVYKYTAANYTKAKATYDKAVEDAAKDAKTAAQFKTAVDTYITAANAFLNGAAEQTVKAADLAAAQAAIADLKAAATPEAAEAALAKYAALTDAQKALVPTADVTKAEAIVAEAKAQAELIIAQDKAAAADGKAQVKGTTYKIKAKGSKTIKIAKSASGAKVTLKQVSGTKYAKVSGTKVTLKKAAKKGKKYTIKVKAVCGATTTSTVSFKVLVK